MPPKLIFDLATMLPGGLLGGIGGMAVALATNTNDYLSFGIGGACLGIAFGLYRGSVDDARKRREAEQKLAWMRSGGAPKEDHSSSTSPSEHHPKT